MPATVIAPALAEAVDAVTVAPDGLSATLGAPLAEQTLEGPNAAVVAQKLGATLYQTVHVGRESTASSRPRTLRDRELDRLFAEAMPHRTALTRAVVHETAADGSFVAEINGLRVLLEQPEPADALPRQRPAAATLALPAARPAVSPGFFLADGSRGIGRGSQLLRVYVHLTAPDAAPAVWAAVLGYLEDQRLPYRAKVSSSPDLYPRRDALVVYLGPQAWPAALGVADVVQPLAGVGSSTSPFLHRIAPGVGVAWEPEDPRSTRRGLSFGEHRAGVLAEALVRHATLDDGPDDGPDDGLSRYEAVAEAYLNAVIDPLNPARNLSSPAVPALGLL